MIIGNDTLFVSYEVRNEVAIIRNGTYAESIKYRSLELLSLTAVMSLAFVGGNLLVMGRDSQGCHVEMSLEN